MDYPKVMQAHFVVELVAAEGVDIGPEGVDMVVGPGSDRK